MIAATPEPPYFVVSFTSQRSADDQGYAAMAEWMLELAQRQPGFLGVESARSDGLGITLSYWRSEDDIQAWREHAQHLMAQEQGRTRGSCAFTTRVAKVERAYSFTRKV